ncbi:hypothetical protein [Candidatus Nitrosocosmicus sp. R]
MASRISSFPGVLSSHPTNTLVPEDETEGLNEGPITENGILL